MGKATEEEVYSICIYSGGGITREEGFRLSHKERKQIMKILKDKNTPS